MDGWMSERWKTHGRMEGQMRDIKVRQGIDESSRGTGYFRFSVMRDQLVLAQGVYCEILGNFVSRFLNFGNLKSAMGVWVWDMYAMELGKSYKSEFCFLS